MLLLIIACNNNDIEDYNNSMTELTPFISASWVEKDCSCESRSAVWSQHRDADAVREGCLPYNPEGLNIIRDLTTCNVENKSDIHK